MCDFEITIAKPLLLINIFNRVGVRFPIGQLLIDTGIKNEKCLKTYCWQLRKDGIMDIKLKFGFVERFK